MHPLGSFPDATRFTVPIAALLLLLLSVPALATGESADNTIQFLTGPNQGDAYDIAQAYMENHREELGLTSADLQDVVVSDRYVTKHNGTTHIYLQQRLRGIEVYNGLINVNVARDGRIINLGNGFVSGLAAKANVDIPALTDQAAIARAAEHFGLAPGAGDLSLLSDNGGIDRRATFAGERLSRRDIPVQLVYQPLADGSVRLAWQTSLDLPHTPDYWSVRVDAWTGDVLSTYNFTNNDSYLAIRMPPFSDFEDAGGQTVEVDPADPIASPFGWHDTDGVAGAEFTDTQGNNVDAHDDLDANNSGGTRPDGGASLDFAFAFNPALPPTGGTNLEAAIVNLFYANNVMHDLTYHYGFDEAAGNFQTNNYGNGGLGNDQVEADAQDGSGTNNANFATPADGFAPRMQMFIWTFPFDQIVTVNPPSSIAGTYLANSSNNGGTGNGLTAEVAIAVDGTPPINDACQPLTSDLTGKIALIRWNQGACNSSVFVLNAANAGAVGAIIIDNTIEPETNFGGNMAIPSVGVGVEDGELMFVIIDDKGETVNVTLLDNPDAEPDRDSDLDNGIIAHEYGHGISNRLTGGPANSGCLNGSERAGEGWSDFWTMVLSAKSSDTPTLGKGVGNYSIFEPINGPGIRNFPYSTDLAVNPQTYVDISDPATSVPHGVGSIWMTMVWEMYWELVLKHGFDGDFYTGSGGNNLTIQLVMDGMKLQKCNPTFVDARDAILLADMNNNAGENACEIWRAFAKRGLGVNAIGGGVGVGDEVEDFTIPGTCPAMAPSIFTDSFESGDTGRWSATIVN